MTNCGRPEPVHDNGTWPALAVQTKLSRGLHGGIAIEEGRSLHGEEIW